MNKMADHAVQASKVPGNIATIKVARTLWKYYTHQKDLLIVAVLIALTLRYPPFRYWQLPPTADAQHKLAIHQQVRETQPKQLRCLSNVTRHAVHNSSSNRCGVKRSRYSNPARGLELTKTDILAFVKTDRWNPSRANNNLTRRLTEQACWHPTKIVSLS